MDKEQIQFQEQASNYSKLKRNAIFLGVCGCLITGGLGLALGNFIGTQSNKVPSELEEFISVYEYLKDNFYKDTSSRALVDGLYYGLTNAFDEPYTYYTSSANGEEQNYSTSGVGVGIQRSPYYGNCLITRVMRSSPAWNAGLRDGDIIYAVQQDGSSEIVTLKDIPLSEWGDHISGENNSKVKVFYYRDSISYETTITRGKFTQDAVYKNSVVNKNGYTEVYLTIATFLGDNQTTGDLLYSQLDEVIKQYGKIDHLVIDLRDNGGGYVDYCVDALGVFLNKGSTALIYHYQNDDEVVKTTRKKQIKVENNNIDLLINDGTASASETFVMGLVDSPLDGVEVYGQISYGKGVAQSFVNVYDSSKDGSGTIRYTFAYTSSENLPTINRIGIEPDFECGYVPSLEKVYRHYVKGVEDNSLLSDSDKQLILSKIEAVLGKKQSSFQDAITSYQTKHKLTNSNVFDEETASHLQEELYTMFEHSASEEYYVDRNIYDGYVQGKADNDDFSSTQRKLVRAQIATLLSKETHTEQKFASFEQAVGAFQDYYGLTGKNNVFDKETADLLQGHMYDLGREFDALVLEETHYGE